MRAGVPSASFINLASRSLICKKQMHLPAIAIVPVTGVALQLEIGVTIREQCAALNDSLQIRLEPRWSSACRRRVHIFHAEGCVPFSRQGKCPIWNRAIGNCRRQRKSGSMRSPKTSVTARSSRSRVNAWTGHKCWGPTETTSGARTACDLDGVVFASERTVTTPMQS